MKKLLIISVCAALAGCSSSNLEQAKQQACERWKQVGYQCVGYEGYEIGMWFGGQYGGAKVWHSLRREENPSVIYTGYVQFWGDELHIYGPKAIDAISGARK